MLRVVTIVLVEFMRILQLGTEASTRVIYRKLALRFDNYQSCNIYIYIYICLCARARVYRWKKYRRGRVQRQLNASSYSASRERLHERHRCEIFYSAKERVLLCIYRHIHRAASVSRPRDTGVRCQRDAESPAIAG